MSFTLSMSSVSRSVYVHYSFHVTRAHTLSNLIVYYYVNKEFPHTHTWEKERGGREIGGRERGLAGLQGLKPSSSQLRLDQGDWWIPQVFIRWAGFSTYFYKARYTEISNLCYFFSPTRSCVHGMRAHDLFSLSYFFLLYPSF